VFEVVFVLLESPSPSRRIFIGSHSLPPSLVRRIGPSTSSCSPTLDVIEAVPIETQHLTNTNEYHRSRPPTPDPIETQAHTEIVEPWRSYPPTPDTTANVDGQQ
jgi:hypothetical protein